MNLSGPWAVVRARSVSLMGVVLTGTLVISCLLGDAAVADVRPSQLSWCRRIIDASLREPSAQPAADPAVYAQTLQALGDAAGRVEPAPALASPLEQAAFSHWARAALQVRLVELATAWSALLLESEAMHAIPQVSRFRQAARDLLVHVLLMREAVEGRSGERAHSGASAVALERWFARVFEDGLSELSELMLSADRAPLVRERQPLSLARLLLELAASDRASTALPLDEHTRRAPAITELWDLQEHLGRGADQGAHVRRDFVLAIYERGRPRAVGRAWRTLVGPALERSVTNYPNGFADALVYLGWIALLSNDPASAQWLAIGLQVLPVVAVNQEQSTQASARLGRGSLAALYRSLPEFGMALPTPGFLQTRRADELVADAQIEEFATTSVQRALRWRRNALAAELQEATEHLPSYRAIGSGEDEMRRMRFLLESRRRLLATLNGPEYWPLGRSGTSDWSWDVDGDGENDSNDRPWLRGQSDRMSGSDALDSTLQLARLDREIAQLAPGGGGPEVQWRVRGWIASAAGARDASALQDWLYLAQISGRMEWIDEVFAYARAAEVRSAARRGSSRQRGGP